MVSTSKQERQETSINQQHLRDRSSRSPRWVGQKVPPGGGGISGRAPGARPEMLPPRAKVGGGGRHPKRVVHVDD